MKTPYKYILILGILLFLCLAFLVSVRGILLPFILAFVLAYLLNPLVEKMSKIMGRSLASGLIVGVVLFVFVSFLLLLLPLAQAQISDFASRVPLMTEKVWTYIKRLILLGNPKMSYQQLYQISGNINQISEGMLNSIGTGLDHLISGGLAVIQVLALLFISPIVLFYVLKDLPQMKKEKMIPEHFRPSVREFLSDLNKTLSGFLRGQASVCMILAFYYGIALELLGINLGIIVGILTGILSFIPYVGFFTGLVISILLALAGGATMTQWILLGGIFLIGNILEGYVLTPYLVGKRVGLHPLWILFSVLAGGCLAGFLGVLLAVPVAAVIGVTLRWLNKLYQASSFYKGEK